MTGRLAADRLKALLSPRSVAIVGASQREGSAGHGMLAGLLNAGYDGALYPVNPRYDTVQGLACHGSLRDLPGPVDLAVLGVNSTLLEAQLDDAIATGARSATIFDTCYLDGETDRGLLRRLKSKAREAGLPVCGGNGMGFLNLADRIPVTIFDASDKLPSGGNVSFITHSGTVFSEIGINDFRYACNLIVSCGQEISGTMADYMDYALDMPSTRVIALFIEEARDPEGFVAALARAREQDVPVVAMKVGRTEMSRRFARIHSGADSGCDHAYQAVFDRYGVMRVGSMDEMANLLTLLSHDRTPATGGLGVVLDSGGEREMLTDLALDIGVPLAGIGNETVERLRPHLHHALEPVNPLDAWGTAANYEDDFEAYFVALADDPDVAMVIFCGDFQWNPTVERGYAKALVAARKRTTKPVAALINTPMSGLMTAGLELTEHGVMALSGTREGLHALRHALAWHNRKEPGETSSRTVEPERIDRVRQLLRTPASRDQAALLKEFGFGCTGGQDAGLTLSMAVDRQFGALISLGVTGSHGEQPGETAWSLPATGCDQAAALIDSLAPRDFQDREILSAAIEDFSLLARELADLAASIDVEQVRIIGKAAVASGIRVRGHKAA